MCRTVLRPLLGSVCLILMCLNSWALGYSETEAVCHVSGKKVCVTVEKTTSYEKWLWFSTSCDLRCEYYHDAFVEQFFPLEHLSEFDGFGINLRKKSDGRLVWSHYMLGRGYKKQALIVEIEVTKEDRFESPEGKLFNQLLLEDLSRLQPVTPELLKRHSTNYRGWLWWGLGHTVSLFSGFFGSFLFLALMS
ncbi:hypothetical protein [Endozoicomonas sp. ALB032]|uniref:hypothetical protein n=1 Tax=Endozoicomonas sp. ALB032 TaxID=3403082 RepID=UPI003BB7D5A3